jgi:hypothetical protein
MQIIKKTKKPAIKADCLTIRVTKEFKDRWKKYAKDNNIVQSYTIMAILEEIMNKDNK